MGEKVLGQLLTKAGKNECLDKRKLLKNLNEERSVLVLENELDQAMDSAFGEIEDQIKKGWYDVPVVSVEWLKELCDKIQTLESGHLKIYKKALLSAVEKEASK